MQPETKGFKGLLEPRDSYDDFDSQKFWAAASVPQLYTTIGSDSLVINGLYSTVTNPVVALGVKLPTTGDYSLNANQITLVGESVYLEDRLLGIFQDLSIEPGYGFNSSVAGNIPTRFVLHFGMTVTGIEEEASNTRVYASDRRITILLDENLTGASVEVLDVAGRIIRTVPINETRTDLEMNVAMGVYLVRVSTEKSNDTHRVFIK
ncbi:T9SS type A sorting domain-containing protein [Flavobacteriales bacterium]|nr:T9SS type A sorting domain-containing protein [Flavobacteriales bacterium]